MKNIHDITGRIYEGRVLSAVRKGLLTLFPLIIIGSFAQFLAFFPAESYSSFMDHVFGQSWRDFLTYLYNVSFGIMSAALVVTICHHLLLLRPR